jgi:4'-phosphopantetheinyl transferase
LDDLDTALHPNERLAIGALPPDERRSAALRCWVRKEAYLKGIGTGLGIDPAGVEVGLGPAIDPSPGRPAPDGWTIVDLDAGPDHLVSVAVAPGGAAAGVRVATVSLAELLGNGFPTEPR